MADQYTIEAIGYIRSPYKEKFGIPRQPGLVPSIQSVIELKPPYDEPECWRGIEQCSHIWISFIFNENSDKGWKPLVRPPRLGGNDKLGVFATRSPFRPNAIGLSSVKLEHVEQHNRHIRLFVSGADLLDQTPIIDIKPYIPYADKLEQASYPMMESSPEIKNRRLVYNSEQGNILSEEQKRLKQPLKTQLHQLLMQDPRPAYQQNEAERIYGITLYDLNIRFSINETEIIIHQLQRIKEPTNKPHMFSMNY